MKSLSLIHTSWLTPFAEFFAARRVNLRPYLEESNIEPKLVLTSGDGWITKPQLYQFLNAIAEGEKMPELGFVVGESLSPMEVGGIGEALAEAETLGDAIRIFCRLINRSTEENRTWLKERDQPDELWLLNQTTNPFPADRRIPDHAGLVTLINLVRLAGDENWYPEKVTLQTEPTGAWKKIEGFEKTAFAFNQSATGFAFPAEWLLQPIRSGETKPKPLGQGLLEENEAVVEKLQRLLRGILGVGGIGPTVTLMAELCGTSPRTLRRRLTDQGLSYRELLDDARIEKAKDRLRNSELSIKELAFDLGYSGANNFIRAFKRLKGMTPEAFRAQHSEEETDRPD